MKTCVGPGRRPASTHVEGKNKGADKSVRATRFVANYFLGAIASFAALATRNFTTVLALI
jgi:hypothetical protein